MELSEHIIRPWVHVLPEYALLQYTADGAGFSTHLSERHGDAGDGVVVRAALQGGEDGEVDLVLQVIVDLLALLVHGAEALPVEDEAGPGEGSHIQTITLLPKECQKKKTKPNNLLRMK